MNTNSGYYTDDPTLNTATFDLNGFDAPTNVNCTVKLYKIKEKTNYGGLTLTGNR